MRIILQIARYDFMYLLRQPLGWALLTLSQLMIGIFYFTLLHNYHEKWRLAIKVVGVNYEVVTLFFGSFLYVAILLIPVLAMRAITHERKTGTLAMLFASPISEWQITCGKFLANFAFIGICLMIMVLMSAFIGLGAQVDYGNVFAGLIATLLLTSSFTAITLFVACCTRQPVGAIIAGTMLLVGFVLLEFSAASRIDWVDDLIQIMAIVRRFENLINGLFSIADIAYLLFLTMLFLLLTAARLRALRTAGA